MAWQPARVNELLGEQLSEASGPAIRRLVDEQIAESDDLEFKGGLYRLSDGTADERRKQRLEAAKDIAALANHRGGVVVLGIRENSGDGTARSIRPFKMSDSDWRHLAQAVLDFASPPIRFERIFIPTEPDGAGIVALVVPPSLQRPHAIVDGRLLLFPVRDHRDTRYLGEPELSAWYQRRQESASERNARLEMVRSEGLDGISLEPWLWLALTPEQPANWVIDSRQRRAARDWLAGHRFESWLGGAVEFATSGTLLVGRRKLRIANLDGEGRAVHTYAEIHGDGSIFVAKELTNQLTQRGKKLAVGDLYLFASLYILLHFAARSSSEVSSAFGPVVVQAGVTFPQKLALSIGDDSGFNLSQFSEGEAVESPATEPVYLQLDEIRSPAGAIEAMRFIGGELAQAYGLPEVRTISEKSELRIRNLPEHLQTYARQWAGENNVPATEVRADVTFY